MAYPTAEIVNAEAHLYVGIAKADGAISSQEYAQIPYYAEKSYRHFDKQPLPDQVEQRIGLHIRQIILNPSYTTWSAEDHLNHAAKILRQALREGQWHAKLVLFQNAEGFLESARIDSYVVKEANFIKKMEEELGGDSWERVTI